MQLSLWPELVPTPTAPASTRTRDVTAAFLASHNVRETSLEHYRVTLGKLARAFPDELPSKTEHLAAFLKSQPVADSTRDGYYRDLRVFFKWAHNVAGVPNAAAGLQRRRYKAPLPEILTRDQVSTLLRAAGRRDRALLAFMLDTGARVSEVAGVTRDDIVETAAGDRRRYMVRLRGSEDARGNWRLKTGERRVPLSAHAAQLLTGVGDGNRLWVSEATNGTGGRTGEPLSLNGIQQLVRRTTKRLLGRAYGPHAMRHTFATMYLRNGGDVVSLQRIMGHAKLETTLIYLQLADDDLADKHAAYSPVALSEAQ